jgi:DNA-binding transcriptional LysR family regulator
MVMGVEASVSLCLDAFFPLRALAKLCRGFAKAFPAVNLRVETQVMSAVAARVLSGEATLGVIGPMGLAPGLMRTALASIRMSPVVSSDHPFSKLKAPISTKRLADSVQIVLSERSDNGVADQAVLSPRTWRVGDLHTKRALLCAGLGWGNLPEHLARRQLRTRKLIRIRPEAWAEDEHTLHLSAIYRNDTMFGPAHRWLLAQLAEVCVSEIEEPRKRRPARAARSLRR